MSFREGAAKLNELIKTTLAQTVADITASKYTINDVVVHTGYTHSVT